MKLFIPISNNSYHRRDHYSKMEPATLASPSSNNHHQYQQPNLSSSTITNNNKDVDLMKKKKIDQIYNSKHQCNNKSNIININESQQSQLQYQIMSNLRTLPTTKLKTNKTHTLYNTDIIEVNLRYTSLVGMCLGFLFIWCLLITSLLFKSSYEEKLVLQKPVEIFYNQERIGRIMFQIGQEMRMHIN